MQDTAPVAPFWMFAIALLLVLVIIASFPRAGMALLGVLVLVLLVNVRRQGIA